LPSQQKRTSGIEGCAWGRHSSRPTRTAVPRSALRFAGAVVVAAVLSVATATAALAYPPDPCSRVPSAAIHGAM
jgi:hypothetical protein